MGVQNSVNHFEEPHSKFGNEQLQEERNCYGSSMHNEISIG